MISGTHLKCSNNIIDWNVVSAMVYKESVGVYNSLFGIMPLRYISASFLTLSVCTPTARGLTCLSSPTTITFFPKNAIARAVKSD